MPFLFLRLCLCPLFVVYSHSFTTATADSPTTALGVAAAVVAAVVVVVVVGGVYPKMNCRSSA